MSRRRQRGLGRDDNVDLLVSRLCPILLLMYYPDRRHRVYLLVIFTPVHPHLYPEYDV